jgi:hypothetical protein
MPYRRIYSLCFHLAAAAFFATSRRSSGESLAALAWPPLEAPSLPSATAAGFLGRSGLGGAAVPVASATMAKASELTSLGRLGGFSGCGGLLAREGILDCSMRQASRPSSVSPPRRYARHEGANSAAAFLR